MEKAPPKRPRCSDGQNERQDKSFFKSYADISVHRLMIEDKIRTSAYRHAILRNYEKIRGSVVADIGAGTGILSMFCVHAGAKRVYAIEASDMAPQIELVVKSNGMQDKITVIHGKAEDVELPEKVDVIVSEWMGYFMLYETMLPSVLLARDKWLNKGGMMLPSSGSIYVAPITDPEVYEDSVNFWDSVKDAYKVDMSALKPYAKKCLVNEVHVLSIIPEDVQAHAVKVVEFDFATVQTEDVLNVKGNFCFTCFGHAMIHGFAVWFTVEFPKDVSLSTSPYKPETHWQQGVVYVEEPFQVEQDSRISGSIGLSAHPGSSRSLDIKLVHKVNDGQEVQKTYFMHNDFHT